MDGYVPSTDRIRDGYALSAADPERARQEFDRWFRPFARDHLRIAQIRAILKRDKDDDGQAVLP